VLPQPGLGAALLPVHRHLIAQPRITYPAYEKPAEMR
jgi:hypothetical protein